MNYWNGSVLGEAGITSEPETQEFDKFEDEEE